MQNIAVSDRGAVLFPNDICIDGHSDRCKIRIVTHIHSDHILELDKSIARAKQIIATPITMDLLSALGFNIPPIKRVELDYGSRIHVDTSLLRFEIAHHIAGTAQVILETVDGIYAYTSDFKKPIEATPIVKDADILVIDATYGDPRYRRVSEEIIIEKLVKLMRNLMVEKPIAVYAYYGKAQEAMQILREYGIDAPFIASSKQWRVLQILRKYGINVKDVILEGTREALEIKRSGWYIAFYHHTKFYTMRRSKQLHHVLLSGWLFSTPIRALDENAWIVALSDHADFDELITYVDNARPRLLIVDAYRGGVAAHKFARYVEQNLGIPSIPQPRVHRYINQIPDLNL